MVGPDSIKVPRGEGFSTEYHTQLMDEETEPKESKEFAHILKTGVCQRKDLNLGSTCQCSFYYTAHIKCAQMHAHIYEHITKNSMGAGGLLGRKEKEIRGKVERTRRGKANLQVF